ncbi:hypothetical protein EVG20_g10546 [Dentipellis fragilis]|uniref:Uncharacterized protein n=1 Tax=Dentipellis fragilis TaxID=205917 RepID=A0A4Y9XSS7_9AGAM|nr:hypothetical protein EVG20_g10546 [Dentipellis fragilis]
MDSGLFEYINISPTLYCDDAEMLYSQLPPGHIGTSVAWDGQATYNTNINILPSEPLDHVLALLESRDLPACQQVYPPSLTLASRSIEDRWTLQPTCGDINDPYNIHPQDIVSVSAMAEIVGEQQAVLTFLRGGPSPYCRTACGPVNAW